MYGFILGIISVVSAGGAVYEFSKKKMKNRINNLSDAELLRHYEKQKHKTKKVHKEDEHNTALLQTLELEIHNRELDK